MKSMLKAFSVALLLMSGLPAFGMFSSVRTRLSSMAMKATSRPQALWSKARPTLAKSANSFRTFAKKPVTLASAAALGIGFTMSKPARMQEATNPEKPKAQNSVDLAKVQADAKESVRGLKTLPAFSFYVCDDEKWEEQLVGLTLYLAMSSSADAGCKANPGQCNATIFLIRKLLIEERAKQKKNFFRTNLDRTPSDLAFQDEMGPPRGRCVPPVVLEAPEPRHHSVQRSTRPFRQAYFHRTGIDVELDLDHRVGDPGLREIELDRAHPPPEHQLMGDLPVALALHRAHAAFELDDVIGSLSRGRAGGEV